MNRPEEGEPWTRSIGRVNEACGALFLVYGLLAVGIFFTDRLRLVQTIHFGELFRVVRGSRRTDRGSAR